MEIYLADNAGFCFGVDRAVKAVFQLLDDTDEKIYTLGPIIHNDQVVDNLTSKGVTVINNINDIKDTGCVVIRAHGVVPDVYDSIREKDLKMIDVTCPYVKNIHNMVRDKFNEGYHIIIVGDKKHPEVVGINGWCDNAAVIVGSIEDAQALPGGDEKVCAVAQTTLPKEKWDCIFEILKDKYSNVIKSDTICYATSKRQIEASELSKTVDMMLVIGGRNSSNTQKLFDVCKKYCVETYKIETSGDLPPVDIKKINKIGITAGTSTPDWVIKEVVDKMEELNMQDNEMSFKEAFESSLVTLRSGEIVKGRIIGYNNTEVFVDMGYKSDGIIPMGEFSSDPGFKPEDSIKAGDVIDVFIVRVNDGEGSVLLSKKKVDSIIGLDVLEKAYDDKTPVKATISDVVNGGVIATAFGQRIFIPASQVSDRYSKDLNEFLKQTVDVRIIDYNKQKRKIVGSSRVILEEEKEKTKNSFWESIEIGKRYIGTVKNLTDFGAFVDIGGADGLIHLTELSWKKVKHPSEILKPGDKVDVTIIEFDKDKHRISLGYRKTEDNPWSSLEEKYKVGDIVKGTVVRLVPFGAFVELENGVDGLIHISQISNLRIAKPGDVLQIGQEVDVKIIELNLESKKISLSLKEVNSEPVTQDNEIMTDENEPTTGHKENMSNTLGEITGEMVTSEEESKE